MLFDKVLEESNMKENHMKVKIRQAVRGIIIRDGKLLLVQSNKGDYKFPGGGVEEGESYSSALIREVAEETGYINCVVKDKVGFIKQRKIDVYDPSLIFQMNSHYYLCELTDHDQIRQQLDEYELLQDFSPKWVSIDEAIVQNEKNTKETERNDWVFREILVLKELKKYFSAF